MSMGPKTITVRIRFRVPADGDDERPPDHVVKRFEGSVKLERSVTWVELRDLEAGKLWLYPYDIIEEILWEEKEGA